MYKISLNSLIVECFVSVFFVKNALSEHYFEDSNGQSVIRTTEGRCHSIHSNNCLLNKNREVMYNVTKYTS